MVEEIITFVSDEEKYNIPFVDEWIMREEDEIIRFEAKDILLIPVSKMFYGIEQSILDFFVLKKKRCYKDDKFRVHIAIYLNYFEKFFDTDHELISAYAMIKYMIHTEKHYTEDNLMRDVKKYILSPSVASPILIQFRPFGFSVMYSSIGRGDPPLSIISKSRNFSLFHPFGFCIGSPNISINLDLTRLSNDSKIRLYIAFVLSTSSKKCTKSY